MQPVFSVTLHTTTNPLNPSQSIDATLELRLEEYALELQAIFKEQKQTLPRMASVSKSIRETNANIEDKKAGVEAVNEEIDQLQKQIDRLIEERKPLVDVIDLDTDQLESLSQENAALLQTRNEFMETVSSSRDVTRSSGEERASKWHQEMLEYLSDTLFCTDKKLDDTLFSMQDRAQNVFMQAVNQGNLVVMNFLFTGLDSLVQRYHDKCFCGAMDYRG